ncbi:DIS3-like exonuclease 1 [Haliotis cracherodii]|uniref:DIS3-like exonuclease 1 n=1 Tax=Haliotis cracherodii TaxID=6455 RepID=UPI0039EBBC73
MVLLSSSTVRTERQLRVKSRQGGRIRVVRELYLREDIPCQSSLCVAGCLNSAESLSLLPSDVTHYVFPDCQVARDYLEILEAPEIRGIVFTQTVANSVQHDGSKRLYSRLRNIVKDPRRGSITFHNEFQKYAYCERQAREPLNDWHIRSTYQAAEWFYNHLAGQMPVVMVTQNQEAVAKYSNRTLNVFVMCLKDYLVGFLSSLTGAMDLYESLTAALESKTTKDRDYLGYLPSDVLEAGIKSGRYISGCINVNKHNAMTEAFVKRTGRDLKEESDSDILIHGTASRNRAVHGDKVVVELLPRSQWKGRSLSIKELGDKTGETTGDGETTSDDMSSVMPTGRIVGVLQRNWRDYVASFSADEEAQKNANKAGKVLLIPWDYRIPKIRISTRQVGTLREDRIIVRIDSWDVDSQYPNGHFVRSLGKIGELETEIAALLVENNISVPPFSDLQLKELPTDTQEQPWTMVEEEVSVRRDLRQSHLIFSIDPKGCEDVDDTLSIRQLPHGNYELGVHIADVTYFVKPGSLSDVEARSRSTSVYLADRRYDMLPTILSANLCSLISGVDRYAMSVIWELTPDFEVKDVWYGRTVIRSQYKLFYELAQSIYDGAADEDIVSNVPELHSVDQSKVKERLSELKWAVCKLMEVARVLKSRRVSGGALELESVEVRVEMDDSKKIDDLTPKDHLEIHDTIAECMIFANHWVARKIAEVYPNQALLRHHPLPRQDHFANLINCAASKGFTIDVSSNKALAASLDSCVDSADPTVNKLLRTLATQAMSNAQYFSTGSLARDQFFHYGLALDLYTHFTSPIRRYADILVHRQLLAAIGADSHARLPGNKELDELSNHINQKHRASQNSQRDSQEIFQALFFRDKSPNDASCIVDAVIFQIRANGVLAFLPRYGIKGPVYLRNKDNLVANANADRKCEWTGGSLSRTDTSITITSPFGSHTYKLFDHITVQIILMHSRAHSSALKLELISNTPHLEDNLQHRETSHSNKADIIKEVRSAAEDKKSELPFTDLSSNFLQLKAEYGQTAENHSLYCVFQSFREMGLTVD